MRGSVGVGNNNFIKISKLRMNIKLQLYLIYSSQFVSIILSKFRHLQGINRTGEKNRENADRITQFSN